ncbi:hypothetical protein ACFPZI_22440 [Streptomyces chlorus]|uniref:Uncharacterized protein n=1 Tax=Streptomyces chlorus TaxID=887452 RepID=A0ABW1E2I0_9ACTN
MRVPRDLLTDADGKWSSVVAVGLSCSEFRFRSWAADSSHLGKATRAGGGPEAEGGYGGRPARPR